MVNILYWNLPLTSSLVILNLLGSWKVHNRKFTLTQKIYKVNGFSKTPNVWSWIAQVYWPYVVPWCEIPIDVTVLSDISSFMFFLVSGAVHWPKACIIHYIFTSLFMKYTFIMLGFFKKRKLQFWTYLAVLESGIWRMTCPFTDGELNSSMSAHCISKLQTPGRNSKQFIPLIHTIYLLFQKATENSNFTNFFFRPKALQHLFSTC